ncbi:MAG: hypothetical protein NXI04_08355 [Planctomycetaceae bacterium]|nr:hypothetical protein [Planctomycetaceae bacterium]
MENRFAGAKDHSDRRRRWLSQEERLETAFAEHLPETGGSPGQDVESRLHESLTRRVISRRLWLVALSVVTLTALSAAVIWLKDSSRQHFGVGSLAQLPEDLMDRYSGLLLLAGGLYALFIGWIRSESEVDFKGRYRSWRWLALYLGLIGSFQILAIGPLLPELLSRLLFPLTGTIQAARPAVVLAVSLTVSAFLLYRILPDMGRCVWSQATLTSAVLMMIVRFMLQHSSHNDIQQATLDALFLLSANTTLAALLLHCWYVAWISNAPPVAAKASQEASEVSRSEAAKTGDRSDDQHAADVNSRNAGVERSADHSQVEDHRQAEKVVTDDDNSQGDADKDLSTTESDERARRSKRRKSRRKRRAA